jgi:hypothetical protein
MKNINLCFHAFVGFFIPATKTLRLKGFTKFMNNPV